MKRILAFGFLLSAVVTVSVSAQQKRMVTNEDLEKFKSERLAAERDYRENYERMGFPSPEELEKRNEQRTRDLTEYASRLREQRIAEEYAAALGAQPNFGAPAPPPADYYRSNSSNFYYSLPLPLGGYYNYGNSGRYGNSRSNYPRGNRFPNSDYINGLRQTDYINRRNGYNSPFQIRNQLQNRNQFQNRPARPGAPNRGGRRN